MDPSSQVTSQKGWTPHQFPEPLPLKWPDMMHRYDSFCRKRLKTRFPTLCFSPGTRILTEPRFDYISFEATAASKCHFGAVQEAHAMLAEILIDDLFLSMFWLLACQIFRISQEFQLLIVSNMLHVWNEYIHVSFVIIYYYELWSMTIHYYPLFSIIIHYIS